MREGMDGCLCSLRGFERGSRGICEGGGIDS